jgi:predicted branched-subunit amino acid permease
VPTPSDASDPEADEKLDWRAFRVGAWDAFGLPALMLMASLIGVGGLVRDIGYPMGAGVLSTMLIWAAPGQMVLFGSIAAGAALPAVAAAVSLSSIRFLPMCVALLPILRGPKTPTWQLLLCAHYVAITAWVHGMRVLPDMPRSERIPYFLGFANTVLIAATISTGLGYYVIGQLPAALAAGLLMTSPLFFTVNMVAAARSAVDWLALGLGFALAPVAFAYVPAGLDLLVQGIGAGTLAYLAHRVLAARRLAAEARRRDGEGR